LGLLLPKKLAAGPKASNVWDKFQTTSELDREYLRNETRYRGTENGIANCNLSCAYALIMVNFGSPMAKKTGPEFRPTNALALWGSRFAVTSFVVDKIHRLKLNS